jgi:hypothetical protein
VLHSLVSQALAPKAVFNFGRFLFVSQITSVSIFTLLKRLILTYPYTLEITNLELVTVVTPVNSMSLSRVSLAPFT